LKGEIETYAHYNRDTLFKKILETYPWFTILKIIDIQTVRKLLTEKLIKSLRSNSLKEKYLYVRKRLCEIIPITE